MTRIFAGDLLVADVIVPIEWNDSLLPLLEKYKMLPGGKCRIDENGMKEFAAAVKERECTVAPGGSSANLLVTLSGLLGKEVEIRLLGLVGANGYDAIIRRSLEAAGIILTPDHVPACHMPRSAISYVFVFPDGQCTVATYPGNAKEILKPAMIAEHFVKNCDVLLVQGSLWHKMHTDYAARLFNLCVRHGRRLWLTMPTQPQLSNEEAEQFRKMIPAASLILGNDAELVRVLGGSLDQALQQLQRVLWSNDRHSKNLGPAVAFITFGKEGAAIVSASKIDFIPPVEIHPADIINTIGAGDTAYAGFAAGYLKKLPHTISAQIAMRLAGEKLRINAPRLENPMMALDMLAPDLAQRLTPPKRKYSFEGKPSHPGA